MNGLHAWFDKDCNLLQYHFNDVLFFDMRCFFVFSSEFSNVTTCGIAFNKAIMPLPSDVFSSIWIWYLAIVFYFLRHWNTWVKTFLEHFYCRNNTEIFIVIPNTNIPNGTIKTISCQNFNGDLKNLVFILLTFKLYILQLAKGR